ncbi:hypothetical protein [Streptomyces sp. NPDC053079]|uniref:hypothetical protein n=1 Tax=Streptomyces sp. NPDC053079 TaxID=3365697 RepID=UPI0037D82E01
MPSHLPEQMESAAAGSDDGNPNLVKDGNFKHRPVFTDSKCGYSQALAKGANVSLRYWDYGGSGNPNGQPDSGVNAGEYIDVSTHMYAFAKSDMEDRVDGSNAIDLVGRGDNRHGYIGQLLPDLIPGAQYDVTFWAGAPWYGEEPPHATRMRYKVNDGMSRDDGKALDQEYISVPEPPRVAISGGSWVRQWKQYQRSFIALSSNAYLSFADDATNRYTTGTQLACVSVRLSVPAHDYRIARTAPETSPDNPLTAPTDTPFDGFRVQFSDEANQPLSSRQVSLILDPSATGSHFAHDGRATLTYTGKTGVDGWLSVPAGAVQAGSQQGPMRIHAQLNTTRLGGQADLRVGAPVARFSVYRGGPVTLTRAGETGYPGVNLRANQDDPVPPQNVRVTLPRGRRLQFVAQGDPGYQLTVQNGGQYNGILSPDGQTLTFENVDLVLSGKDSTALIWVAVKAPGNATPGETELSFRVGDVTSPSSSITVVDK